MINKRMKFDDIIDKVLNENEAFDFGDGYKSFFRDPEPEKGQTEDQNRTNGHAIRKDLSKEKAEMIKALCDKNGLKASSVKVGKYDTVTFDIEDGEQHYRVAVSAFNPGPDVESNF